MTVSISRTGPTKWHFFEPLVGDFVDGNTGSDISLENMRFKKKFDKKHWVSSSKPALDRFRYQMLAIVGGKENTF